MTTARPVPAGHALLIAVMLSGTTAGAVSARDAAGSTYTTNADQTDGGGNRLAVLSSLNVAALASGATITLTFPSATAVYTTVDEFAGVAAADGATSAAGTAKTFSSGGVTTTKAGDLLFGAEGQTAAGGSDGHALIGCCSAGDHRRRFGIH